MGVILIIVEIDNFGLYMQKNTKKFVLHFNYFIVHVLLYHKLFLSKKYKKYAKNKI